MRLIFATSNENKFREASEIAKEFGIELIQKKFSLREIQGELEEVSKEKAKAAFDLIKKPVIVEDTSFEIEALKGFPGIYARYVYATIGVEGILKLMKGVKNRKARFRVAVVYYDGKEMKLIVDSVEGRIASEPRGKSGWGFDPIFIPEGYNKTFAEDPKLKQKISHRARAFRKLFSLLAKMKAGDWVKVGEEVIVEEILDKYELRKVNVRYEVFVNSKTGEFMKLPVEIEL